MNRREFVAASLALPFALRAGDAFAAPRSLALVTADTEARVVAVDVVSGRVVRSIPVLPGPRSIESVGGRYAVVAHTALGAVTVLEGLRAVHVLRDFHEPRYTAAHPDGRHAFVTDSGRSEVVAVDLARGRVVGRVGVGGWARHVTLDARGETLVAGLGTAAPRVAVVDVRRLARPRLVAHLEPGLAAHDVAWIPGGRSLWVTSGDDGAMTILDAPTRRRLLRLASGGAPQHVAFGDGVAYVTSGRDGTLDVLALAGGRRLRRTRVPVGSYNVQRAGARILTPSLDRGTLCILDLTGRLLHEVDVAASSHDACVVSA